MGIFIFDGLTRGPPKSFSPLMYRPIFKTARISGRIKNFSSWGSFKDNRKLHPTFEGNAKMLDPTKQNFNPYRRYTQAL